MSYVQRGRQAKYHGLVNQGATCYLNSILQVLFMTKNFRERVTSTLEKHQAGTHSITKKLKINNVFEHRDAAEHYEKILRNISPEASQIFHGQLTNRNKCKQCKTITKSKAGFWSLPLPLVNDNNEYSVEKGIEDFFRPSEISGDDQMYCEKCDKKCDAVLDCEVKHSPEVLVLLLKRFKLKCVGNVWEKVKINCPVKIPDTLQIKQNEIYKLYAYVDHFGSLRQGHYTATIKSQDDGQWYIFDDLSIQVLSYNHFQLDPTQTSESVYLLFYQKQDDTNVDRHDTPNILPTTTLLSQTEDHHSSSEEKAADIKFVTKNQPVTPGSKRNMGGPRYDEQNESMRIRTNGDTETGQTFDQGKQSKHREPNLETFYRDCRDVNEKPKMHNKHNEGEEHGMAKMKQEYFSNEQSLQKVGRDKQHVSQHDITSAYYRHQDGMSYKDKDRQTRQVNHNNSYALSQNEKQWREQTKQTENSSDVYNKSINTNNKQNLCHFQRFEDRQGPCKQVKRSKSCVQNRALKDINWQCPTNDLGNLRRSTGGSFVSNETDQRIRHSFHATHRQKNEMRNDGLKKNSRRDGQNDTFQNHSERSSQEVSQQTNPQQCLARLETRQSRQNMKSGHSQKPKGTCDDDMGKMKDVNKLCHNNANPEAEVTHDNSAEEIKRLSLSNPPKKSEEELETNYRQSRKKKKCLPRWRLPRWRGLRRYICFLSCKKKTHQMTRQAHY